jgi:predicted HicB family RNase H-like nuclease
MVGKGRPTRDPTGEPSKHFIMRLTDAERENYAKAAERAGMSLSEWIRDRLTGAAKRESKRR